ncbi:glycosyltransferase family 2 protein [Cohnella nanjingensis]|uniref:Glycosyltransferase family 2 protein n=1 Tax=Cohnella nanjingensis TaxID=1387779 RepID=A0A7X0VFH9_9BACL|nr:glycosyltransferase family 2 protein [Cohnella nanjingensis]MBB6670629.1 glycosyltransferase family 2 protein [Cohnella nanjingensis]
MSKIGEARDPLVAICIVTYNSAAYIEKCLAAISRQSWQNLITVIVDNASSDSTVAIVRKGYPALRLIANSENCGFAAGQNQAIGATDAEYILVLNADVTLEVDYIANLVDLMQNNPRIGSAIGCLRLADKPDILDSAGLIMKWSRSAEERGAHRPVSEFSLPSEVFGVSGAAAFYRRAMIVDISVDGQFFDEDFFAYKEDVDVAWRARNLGWQAWYEPAAQALHVRQWGVDTPRKRMPLKIRRHSYQNRYLMMAKNESFDASWWIRLPRLLAYEIALNGYIFLKDPKVLGAWKILLRLLPGAIRKRREIRSKRKVEIY